MKGDHGYFDGVVAALEDHPEITGITWNPLTATVLIYHVRDVSPDRLFELAAETACFSPSEPEAAVPPVQALRGLYRQLENDAVRLSGGKLDMESAALGLLLLAAVSGIVRGDIGFPAATALWYVFELVRQRSPREPESRL